MSDKTVINLMMAHSSDGLILFDLEGVILELNDAAAASLNRAKDTIRGRGYREVFFPALSERFETAFARALAGERVESCFVHFGVRWISGLTKTTLADGVPGVLCLARRADTTLPFEEVSELAAVQEDRDDVLGDLASLSEREVQVALLIGSGATDRTIAELLHRSVRTVHAHRRSIGRKLSIESRSQMQAMVRERGLRLDLSELVR